MSLTLDDLNHVLKLAHLRVDESQKSLYLTQLQKIFGHMEGLNQLDLTDIPASSHAFDQATLLREDTVIPQNDLLLSQNAPAWEADCFRVPQILEG